MTFDPQKNTIRLEDDDPNGEMFVLDSAVFLLNVLRDLSMTEDASTYVKNDAKVIFDWLGQDISELSAESIRKFKLGYLAYLSIGVAPTFEQQPLFDRFNAHPNSKVRAQHKPPERVMDAFDRMNATDEEIKKKRKYDLEEELQRIKKGLAKPVKDERSEASIGEKLKRLQEKTKLFWSISALWVLWVFVRSETSFELLGYDFNEWDGDMFFQNAMLVPVVLLIGNFVYERYFKKNK